MTHPLATALRAAAEGRFPAADTMVEIHPRPPGPASAVVAFSGHHVIAADAPEDWLRARLPEGDLLAPLSPRFLADLGDRLGVACDGIDVTLAAPPLDGAVALAETREQEHPRVQRALAHRDEVRAFAGERSGGEASGRDSGVALVLGRGLAGRLEVAFEVDPGARGRGVARAALLEARRLADEPLFAQTAPGNAASLRALLAAGFVPLGSEALFFDRAVAREPSIAIVLTGAPGAGKSSVMESLTTLLGNVGIPYGALESEQLGWGEPWLSPAWELEQLEAICRMQRRFGRRRFMIVATTETETHLRSLLDAIAAERTFVVCLEAPGDVVAERVLEREPEVWAGRTALAEHARELAPQIPVLPSVDLRVSTDRRRREDVAEEIRDALAARDMI